MRFVVLIAAVVCCACNQGSVSVAKVEPGAECPTGGVRVTSGSTIELVCNGTPGTNATNGRDGQNGADGQNGSDGRGGVDGRNGATTLLRQARLPVGDARCPRGGVLVSAGPDSGGDGGVPADGVLQPQEVTSEEVVCGGDDGRVGSLTPPPGAAGTFVIRAAGGNGSLFSGGNGGTISIQTRPTNGGHLKVWKTGRADASFTIPTLLPLEPGPSPASVTGNVVVPRLATVSAGASLPAGTLFLTSDDDLLYVSAGAGGMPQPASSLVVSAGASVTFPSQPDEDGYGIRVQGRCQVDGTITVLGAPLASMLELQCDEELVIGSAGLIDGSSPPNQVDVHLVARVLITRGTIDVSARATGANPHRAGSLRLGAALIYAEGVMRALGGTSSDLLVTRPGRITMVGSVFNAANIDVSAGEFVGAGQQGDLGARGGEVTLGEGRGVVKNRGSIVSNGSRITASPCVACRGGEGGIIRFAASVLVNDADLRARGGAAAGAEGGRGGLIELLARLDREESAFVSGSLDVSGADGEIGGQAGSINVWNIDASQGGELVLLGYSSVELGGGAGASSARGGQLFVVMSAVSGETTPGGAIVFAPDVNARGGETNSLVTTEAGGEGGRIRIQSLFAASGWPWERIDVSGSVRVSGGGGPLGGAGGELTVQGERFVSLGNVEAQGGAGASGQSGAGGSAFAQARRGTVVTSNSIDVSSRGMGSGSALARGHGGNIYLVGDQVRVEGALLARGGAADLQTGHGGNGGRITLESSRSPTVVTAPAPQSIDVSPGAGMTRGQKGSVVIDYLDLTQSWTF